MAKPRNWNAEELAIVQRMLVAGKSFDAIAARFGVDATSILRLTQKHKWRRGKKTSHWNDRLDAAIRDMTADGLCPAVQALILGMRSNLAEQQIRARRRLLKIPEPRAI